jgi:hypothetical protein
MVDQDQALCVMGNHEYNAINFWNPEQKRKHTHSNIIQHFATIKAFQNREEEWFDYLDWFKELPFYLELSNKLRVVHATWRDAITTTDPPIDVVLECFKGAELDLPPAVSYADKDGNRRTKGRTRWWLNAHGKSYAQYMEPITSTDEAINHAMTNTFLDDSVVQRITQPEGYIPDAPPVFFGHYWLRGQPQLQAPNVCCLDYSVAKGGELVCYRFDGESQLDASKFVTVDSLG